MLGLGPGRRQERHRQERSRMKTVVDMRPAEEAVVKTLSATSPEHLNKLMSLGVLPGTKLTLLQRFPSLVLKVGETALALDKTVAQLIEVDQDHVI